MPAPTYMQIKRAVALGCQRTVGPRLVMCDLGQIGCNSLRAAALHTTEHILLIITDELVYL